MKKSCVTCKFDAQPPGRDERCAECGPTWCWPYWTPHPGADGITDVFTQHKRVFATGATRDTDAGKIDYEGFLSPAVLERFGQYMTKHRQMADGSLRDSDNWQKGIPQTAYMKSAWRHFVDWWKGHRGATDVDLEESVCALIFNAQGYLHELLKARGETPNR